MGFRIHVEGHEASFEAADGEPILDAGRRAGVEIPYDCQCGTCSTCRVYLVAGEVSYFMPPTALAPEEEDAGYALACQAIAESDLTIRLAPGEDAAGAPEPAAGTHEVRVAAVERLGHDVVRLALEPPAGGFAFSAGQYLDVVLPDGDTRSFSMASAPGAGVLDLHVRQVPGGRFSEGMAPQLSPGEGLSITGPHGHFRYQGEDGREPVLIAGGTGLAPIKSLLEAHHLDPTAPRARLYWGVRARADLYLDETLRGWARAYPQLRYEPVLSAPDPGEPWDGRVGWVHEAALADLADPTAVTVYACGPPAMIEATKRAFLKAGLSPEHFHADSFDYAHERSGDAA